MGLQEVGDTTHVLWCRYKIVINHRRNTMSITSHLQELRRKHENLSHMVESEQRSPGSDALKIAELKKQKMKLKEEITRLQS
jgi:hypothetical protein